jgi:uncharacterized protein YqfB (UPF0267 family)
MNKQQMVERIVLLERSITAIDAAVERYKLEVFLRVSHFEQQRDACLNEIEEINSIIIKG